MQPDPRRNLRPLGRGGCQLLTPIPRQYVWHGRERHAVIAGKRRVGVTTVLDVTGEKQWLERWQRNFPGGRAAAIEYTKRCARRGSALHKRIENDLLGIQQLSLLDKEFEEQHGLSAEVDHLWASAQSILPRITNPRLIEGPVYWEEPHLEHRYGTGFAGTIDLVADFDGTPTVLDWKSSAKYKSVEWISNYAAQASAYRAAYNHCYARLGYEVHQAAVVIFNMKEQKPQVFTFDRQELDMYWLGFLGRLEEFNHLRPGLPIALS